MVHSAVPADDSASSNAPIVALLVLVGLVILIFLAIVAAMYNRLVTERNHVSEAWSNISAELQRRYELIPNLVNAVKGYATHEAEVLAEVTAQRERANANHGDPASQAADENLLTRSLATLMLRVEAYPTLQADANFRQLQSELAVTENRIQAARRLFNGNVRNYNNKVEVFPSNLLALAFGFKRAMHFRLDDSARGNVDTSF